MHKCLLCNKYYKSPKCLRKHYVKCSLKHNINILDCNNDLFELMSNMMISNERLCERVKKLETLAYKEKKRINVLEWLNENRTLTMTYERFIQNIEMSEEILDYVFNNGLLDALSNIINDKLDNCEGKPLMCFEEKSYVLYEKTVDGWTKLEDDEFKKGVCYLQREILKYFRQENPVEDLFTDKEHNLYNKHLMSICVANFSSKVKNIRNDVYIHNKKSINKIVSYDFDF